MKKTGVLCIGIPLLCTALSASAATNYVSTTGSSTPPYNSWATAATNIQDAVDAAVAGDTVLVTNGTYLLTAEISVTNAITIQSVNGAEGTVVDGQDTVRCFNLGTAACTLEGFTITQGKVHSSSLTTGHGAGIYCDDTTPVINRCIITDNLGTFQSGTGSRGGGVHKGTLNNCLVINNVARFGGGTFESTLNNCTVTGNTSSRQGGGTYLGINNNSIVYLNTSSSTPQHNYNNGTFTNSCTTPLPAGTGNISSNPLFVDAANSDVRLQTASPCIDAGSNALTPAGTDFAGFPRSVNSTVDMGAFEFQPTVVENKNDSGPGSLRYVLNSVSPGVTVTFTNTLDGQTITLTSGNQLLIDKNLTIDASALANGITIRSGFNPKTGAKQSRIFELISGTTVFSNLTLINGHTPSTNPGGAILVNNGASLTINNSTLAGNGAFGDGGAIANLGTLSINNSTLSDNMAKFSRDGGGVYNSGSLSIHNSTLSGNSAEGDGGGIYNSGTLSINNTIVANNTASTNENISGLFSGFNNITSGDPILAPLGSYGGSTQTMPPLPGSPAIDAGDNSLTNSVTDQREMPRVAGTAVDIGAAETQVRVVLNNADAGANSLRDTISSAYSGDQIIFDSSLYGHTITLTNGQLLIDKSLTINSPLVGGITISGNNASRIFNFSSGTHVLNNLNLINGSIPSGNGGAILLNSDVLLTINNSSLSGNSANSSGGGIYNEGTLTVNNSSLSENSASNGGAIYNKAVFSQSGRLIMNNSTIAGNTASGNGAGIYMKDSMYGISEAVINNSIIAGNTSQNIFESSIGAVDGSNNLTNGVPQLAPLGFYGGPTKTMPPLPGSPAIDAGDNSLTNSVTALGDQRGMPRVLASGPAATPVVDIGAVEWNGWLVGLDLSGVDPSSFTPGTFYDNNTIFPDEFDPVAAGFTKMLTQAEIAAQSALDQAQGESNVTNNPNAYGLYTADELLDLAVGDIGIQITNGMAELSVQLWQTDDLITWTNIGGTVHWAEPVDAGKKFFRVRVEP